MGSAPSLAESSRGGKPAVINILAFLGVVAFWHHPLALPFIIRFALFDTLTQRAGGSSRASRVTCRALDRAHTTGATVRPFVSADRRLSEIVTNEEAPRFPPAEL